MKTDIINACKQHEAVVYVDEIKPEVLYSIEFDEFFEFNNDVRNNLMMQLKSDEEDNCELKCPEFFWVSEPLSIQNDDKKDVNLLFAISCIANNLSNKHLGKISFSLNEDAFDFDYCFTLYGFSPDDEINCELICDIISDFRAVYETLREVVNALKSGNIEAAIDVTFPKIENEEVYVDPLILFAMRAKASGVDIKFSNKKEEIETKFLGRFDDLEDEDL